MGRQDVPEIWQRWSKGPFLFPSANSTVPSRFVKAGRFSSVIEINGVFSNTGLVWPGSSHNNDAQYLTQSDLFPLFLQRVDCTFKTLNWCF